MESIEKIVKTISISRNRIIELLNIISIQQKKINTLLKVRTEAIKSIEERLSIVESRGKKLR